MTLGAADLVFKARALAQAHPLSPQAKRYVDRAVGEQRMSQPLPEVGIWAGAALINGYCLRRVEESVTGDEHDPEGSLRSLDELEEEATRVAAELRTGQGGGYLVDEERTVEALDRLIAGDVERRLDHWREDLDERAWDELGEYICWWTVKGYALRVVEVQGSTVGGAP